MTTPVIVGLLDSGVAPDLSPQAWRRRSFVPAETGVVTERDDGAPDCLGHGTELARIILHHEPDVALAVARIFTERFVCTPVAAAAGLDWLTKLGARIVNMSFGLSQDRAVMREACERAVAAGALLVAATPARGQAVFPASYHGVLRVSGDARCGPDEISQLGGVQADFGACPGAIRPGGDYDRTGGASFATAHFTGLAAALLNAGAGAGNADVLESISRMASYYGPERRGVGQ